MPIVLRVCLGYTVDAPLRHSCDKAVGLSGCDVNVTQRWNEVICGAHPKHPMCAIGASHKNRRNWDEQNN